jgi:hypothetical protein
MSEENKSTGPVTPEGKAISSQNALKHGLASRKLFIPGEDEDAFHEMLLDLRLDFKPDGPAEEQLVEEMCIAKWLKDRALRMQSLAFAKMVEGPDPNAIPPDLRLFMRYQINNENHYFRALRALQHAQKEKKRDAQFVSYQATQPRLSARWEPRSVVAYIDRLKAKQANFHSKPPKTRP